MTILHYVCHSPYDGRELSTPTSDQQKARCDLERLRQQYPCSVMATLYVGFDDEGDQP